MMDKLPAIAYNFTLRGKDYLPCVPIAAWRTRLHNQGYPTVDPLKRTHIWEQVGRAHVEFFTDIRPTTSMEVRRLIRAEILVEIEADALVPH